MALEWFLQNLTSGEPPKVDGWPERGRSKAREHSRELPAVPTKSDTIPDPGPPLPNDPFSLDLQEVRDIHVAWRNTRGAYPGWIILPAQNRESLWIRTERWIEPVFESVRQFEAPDDLLLLYELNWRLERCMVPLFENWTEKIMDTLNTYNPYPHLLDLESATITPVETKYAELDWQRLSEAWIGLTFAVARMFREDCKEDKFKAWMERLEPVVSAHSEWKARLVHEHCMFAIARFDQAGARNALSNWPNTEENTLWELRRAAMFAELGEVKESRQIAGRVLSEIRRRSESFSSDRTLLSQEGLTILFLEMLETGDFGLGAEERFRNRDRLERLQTYRCDPRAEINNFEAKIIGLPKPKDSVETTSPSFDPGRETTTTHFASGFIAKESIPAFALLRTAEEGVLLPRVPGVNFFSETALTAARWIEDYAPLWSVSSEIRYGPASKKLYNRFDRVRIATMPQEVVDHVFDILYSPLAQSIEQLQYNAAEAGPGSPSFAMRQALIASELLSRLYFRLSEEQQDKVFVLAASMYGMPLFQTRHWFHDGITSLFKRMLAAETSGNGILRRVPRLLELPIPGENGVDIRLEETWVEPLEHIVWSQEEKFESGLDREAVSPSIERLIRLIRDGTSKIRRRAVTRLNVLHSMGVLTEKEEADFGCALWARRSAVSGLPKDTNFYPHAFLNLEGPEPGRAMEAFRKSIRTRDFLRMTIGGDGENKVISFSLRHANDLYTRDILGATAPRLRDDNDARIYVDWTPEEITAFLQKIVQCWDDEKDELKRVVSEGLDGHFSSIVTQRLEGWLNILARVVLPNIEAADEAGRQTARRLILEMDEAGGPAPLALPALLYVVPEDAEEVAAKIKARIDHNDADEVRAAALGVSLWLEHASADDIPNPPEELLDALIARVVSRKQEAVDVVLISLRAMLQKSPVFFDEARLANLSSALCSLLEDTKLPDYKRREGEDRLGSAIPVELRARRRCLAAQLAHRLYQEFGRRSIDAPDILERWQKMCSQNPLPEVRRAWS
jgi:hypothetical protein